jgi:hypothetical protein
MGELLVTGARVRREPWYEWWMKRSFTLGLLIGLFTLAVGRGDAVADDARQKAALKAPFDAIEKALRAADEALFKAQWYPEGYDKNLIGGSGNTGASMYRQGSRKKWFPRPDLAQATVLGNGEAAIVTCEIWSWEGNKAVDRVDMLVIKVKGAYLVLGGGEKRAQVDALASRWLNKQPLAPAGDN